MGLRFPPRDAHSYDISHVSGNAPDAVKRTIAYASIFINPINREPTGGTRFEVEIVKRLVVSEASVLKGSEEPSKDVGRVVYGLEVNPDMTNRVAGTLHAGCGAYLVDICSSLVIFAFSLAKGGFTNYISQSINVAYHSPAAVWRRPTANSQYDDDRGLQNGISEDRNLEHDSPSTGCFWRASNDAAI
ncbi:hypothetical protein PQX77_014715 [Marasmius sp. AFHP31]|nr:hypothetical protein PQX77_014715 [Marasmius sp. AFHP31]